MLLAHLGIRLSCAGGFAIVALAQQLNQPKRCDDQECAHSQGEERPEKASLIVEEGMRSGAQFMPEIGERIR